MSNIQKSLDGKLQTSEGHKSSLFVWIAYVTKWKEPSMRIICNNDNS